MGIRACALGQDIAVGHFGIVAQVGDNALGPLPPVHGPVVIDANADLPHQEPLGAADARLIGQRQIEAHILQGELRTVDQRGWHACTVLLAFQALVAAAVEIETAYAPPKDDQAHAFTLEHRARRHVQVTLDPIAAGGEIDDAAAVGLGLLEGRQDSFRAIGHRAVLAERLTHLLHGIFAVDLQHAERIGWPGHRRFDAEHSGLALGRRAAKAVMD